jgi:hypothetical protein
MLAGLNAELLPLLIPICRQRPLQLLQHQRLVCLPREDRLHEVRRQQRQPQDPAHVALRDVLGIADLADGRVAPSSSMRCHRQARDSALTSVPSG